MQHLDVVHLTIAAEEQRHALPAEAIPAGCAADLRALAAAMQE
jgi:hypothetical protein